MQAISSSAMGAPVEAQAASEPVEGNSREVKERRRTAMERINASQRHRMSVVPGVPGVITVCTDYVLYAPAALGGSLIGSRSHPIIYCRAQRPAGAAHGRSAQDRS